MDQHAETNPETNPHANPSHGGYPRGRGYGHDYMRGGEVLGGYGYSEREEYRRPRGGGDAGEMSELEEEQSPPRWESAARNPESPPTNSEAQSAASDGETKPPVPEIENTFGTTGGLRHSRSYYVTQAQLQQRIYVRARE